jgi:hypothetical protein
MKMEELLNFEYPMCGLEGQFLLTKINLSIFFCLKVTFAKYGKNASTKKYIGLISIWLIGMPKYILPS